MPYCDHCEEHVTADFYRTFSIEKNGEKYLAACQSCDDSNENIAETILNRLNGEERKLL